MVEAGLVVVVLGVVVLDGLAGTAGLFGVVVEPVDELAPGVIVLPLALAPDVPVVSGFEDCGTPVELAGTQSAVAEVEVLGVELGDVEEVVELLLGEALLVEEVLAVELGEVLELLGVVLLVELLGVEVVLLVEPVALALVLGTMPAGQLMVEDAPGAVELGLVVDVPLCVDGVVPVPLCEAGAEVVLDGEVVVVELVVDVVCAATHVALAVRITSNVNFFIFVLGLSSGCRLRCPLSVQGVLPDGQKIGPASAGPG